MRRLIVSNIMTIDGFYAGKGGSMMAFNMDPSFDDENLRRMRAAGTILLGGSSFELFSTFWPSVADAPEDKANPALSDTNREFSRRYRDIPKIVISDTCTVPADHPWYGTTAIVPRTEGEEAVRAEKAKPESEGDVVVFGSHIMWNALLAAGLVDELHLMVGPAAIGAGVPLFTNPAHLRRLEVKAPEGSDNVLLRYAPVAF